MSSQLKDGRRILSILTPLTIYLLLTIAGSLVLVTYSVSYSDNTMPDAPDDFDYSNIGEFTANLDSSELAARLYSPIAYSRTGQMLYMTDFTRGMSGLIDYESAGVGSLALVSDKASHSGMALKMTTTSADDDTVYVYNDIVYIPSQYITFDIVYWLNVRGQIEFRLEPNIEGDSHRAHIKHTQNPFKLEIYNELGAWTDITALESSNSYFGFFNHLRFTIDTVNKTYHKLTLNGVEFTISGTNYYTVTGSYENEIYIEAQLRKNGGTTAQVNLRSLAVNIDN